MPNKNPRIALTVPDELFSILDEIAALTGRPKAKIALELIELQAPLLRDTLDCLRKVVANKDKASNIADDFRAKLVTDGEQSLTALKQLSLNMDVRND